MKVTIKNLGNVEYGEVDISKPLTVFCGPNNTGKTYVSYILYSLLKQQVYYSRFNQGNLDSVFVEDKSTVKLDIADLIKYRQNKILNISHSLESIFGISDTDKLSLFKNLELQYSMPDDEFAKMVAKIELKFNFDWNGVVIEVSKSKNSTMLQFQRKNPMAKLPEDTYFFSLRLLAEIYDRLIDYPYVRSCIFPVERNSIYTFNKELSIQRNELIEQMQALKDNRNLGYESVDRLLGRSTRYPMAIRDCLSVANDLNNLKKRMSEYAGFAESLEQQLLGGKITVTKEGEVEFLPKRGQRLPIQLSASIVKTLSSLTFYLKHLAKRSDLIIIDEPEMNLHPDAQVELAHIFGRMVNKGLNLLISTHSDYIIRELNNMITLGSIADSPPLMEELNYMDDDILKATVVEVYLFKPKKRNSRVSTIIPVEVKEDGFSMETIDAVINELNEHSDRINYKLKYNE